MENLFPLQSGVHVNQDTRLDNRIIDIRVSGGVRLVRDGCMLAFSTGVLLDAMCTVCR